MVEMHTRHWAFGVALPIITAAYMLLSQNATPQELQASQAPTAFYISIATTLLAGLQDVIKGWKVSKTELDINQQHVDIKQQLADFTTNPPTPPVAKPVEIDATTTQPQQQQQPQSQQRPQITIQSLEVNFTPDEIKRIQDAPDPEHISGFGDLPLAKQLPAYKLWAALHGFKPMMSSTDLKQLADRQAQAA